MKTRTGYIFQPKGEKRWVARVTFTDPFGKRRELKRYRTTKTEARLELHKLLRQLDAGDEEVLDHAKLKFRELAKRYSESKFIEPVYVNEKRVAGLRSLVSPRIYLQVLVEHLGNRNVNRITHSDIEAFKLKRLQAPTRSGGQRSVASVNRELEILRAVLNFAIRQGWLAKNPFNAGGPLIVKSHETSSGAFDK